MKISGVIILGGKVDQVLLKACMNSLSWVDEIVRVDTDKLKGSFSDWRNDGIKRAKGEWILYVDADERVTPALRQEIVKLLDGHTVENSAYAIPRRNFIFGKEFKHGGQWPDYVKRLFKKPNLHGWTGELHEEPHFDGILGHLKNPLIHIKHETLSEMVDKTNKWSEIEAKLMYEAHHPKMNILRFFSAGFREFWLRMIIQLAFLDGAEGVIYGMYQVYSRLISYAKLWEMQIKS